MIRLVTTGIVSLSLFVVATAQQKTQKNETQQPDQAERANKLGTKGDKLEDDQPTGEQNQRTELPELFKQIDLNEQQQQQLLTIYRDSDQKSQKVWDRVQDLHLQAISMEAAAIAAARLEGHDHNAHESKTGQPGEANSTPKANPGNAGTRTGASADPTSVKKIAAPADDAKENVEQEKAQKDSDENNASARKANRREKRATEKSHASAKDSAATTTLDDENLNVVAIRVGIAQPDGRVREYLLTPQNSQTSTDSDPAFNTHTSQLTQVWKDIHDGHEELVEIEADTIVKVEAQLTEAQLLKLDSTESHASTTSKNPNDDSGR